MANNTNWLNISSQSGSSGQTILTLSANKNLSTNHKTAEITAYNPVYNISAKTYVTLESYAPFLSISPGLFGVPDSGGTYELTINANCAWVIAFPDLVTSYSTSAGTGNAVITFTVPGTTADTTLVGNIVVTDESGQISKIAKIEQYGSGVHIGVFPVELYFVSTGGSQTFSVSADAAYNVSVASGTNWAFVEPNSGYTGQTVFTVRVNSGYTGTTDRQGVINIDAPGQDLAVILYQRKPETRLVTVYNVTSTTDPTTILGDTSFFSKAELANGTEIALGTGYTFPSTGNQKVYYTLTGNTVGGFENSTALTQVVIPEGITEIADSAFASCTNLTYIKIPDTVTQVGDSAFSQCNSLSSITLPDSLERMESAVFSGCTSLSSITIPSAVTSIGSNCFSGSSVSSITFTSLIPPTLGDANALTSNTLSEIIVPCPAVNDYITAYPQYAQYISCSETGTTLYFTTDTSNVKGMGETRTITILNTNINPNRIGLNLPSDFPQQGSYVVEGNVIYLTYPANPSSSATRNWTIGVVAMTKDGVSLSGSYNITQNANVTYEIPYTADTSAVDASGETRTITIDTSNLVASSITIGIEGAAGVTYTYENGVITVSFPHNNTASQRDVTITVTGETITGNNASASITYAQEAGTPYEIPYTADTSTVDTTGETRVIYIATSNLVESSITVTVSGGSGVTTSYSNGVLTIMFPNISGSTNDFENYTVLIEGETLNGNYAFANIEYDQYGTDITGVPLTFKILSGGSIVWQKTGVAGTPETTISYKINDGDWKTVTSSILQSDSEIVVSAGDIVRIIGENDAYANEYGYNWFALRNTTTSPDDKNAALYEVYGNILSMIYGADFTGYTTLPSRSSYNFKHLFAGSKCYGAKHLILPSDVKQYCYQDMFVGCPLETAPELPVTIPASYCYAGMFRGTNIEIAPELPAKTLNSYCYANMFYACKKLTQAPSILPAETLANNCYEQMFYKCTNLTTAPELPATTLASGCYNNMFAGCASLTKAPELPATTLADSCYAFMFSGCTSLTQAPSILPARTLKDTCYSSMFSDCSSLTQAPELPATVLANDCYFFMFSGCTSLTTAPVLPAKTLVTNCYAHMFSGCKNLSAVTCLATNTKIGFTAYWLSGVANSGVFIKTKNTHWAKGEDGIPSGWVVKEANNSDTVTYYYEQSGGTYTETFEAISDWTAIISDSWLTVSPTSGSSGSVNFNVTFQSTNLHRTGSVSIIEGENIKTIIIKQNDNYFKPLTFKVTSDGFIKFELKLEEGYPGYKKTLKYNKNNEGWVTITSNTGSSAPLINVNTGDIVQFKGDNKAFAESFYYYNTFNGSTASFDVEGNILSIVSENYTEFNSSFKYMFKKLFYGCNIGTARYLVMPLNTMSTECYYDMFYGCTSLTSAPEELPASRLAEACYLQMFAGCTSLTQAPELPATTLVSKCYNFMFSGCKNLNYVKCLATSNVGYSYTSNWLQNVASSGTFVKNPNMSSWDKGANGIPSNWTVQDAT